MIDNSFNKKSFFRSKGIYILAALCILAAGAGASTKFVFEHGTRIERVENVKDVNNYILRIDEMLERKRVGIQKYLNG